MEFHSSLHYSSGNKLYYLLAKVKYKEIKWGKVCLLKSVIMKIENEIQGLYYWTLEPNGKEPGVSKENKWYLS